MIIKVIITVDDHGHIVLDATGPVNGKAGLLALLEEAHRMAGEAS